MRTTRGPDLSRFLIPQRLGPGTSAKILLSLSAGPPRLSTGTHTRALRGLNSKHYVRPSRVARETILALPLWGPRVKQKSNVSLSVGPAQPDNMNGNLHTRILLCEAPLVSFTAFTIFHRSMVWRRERLNTGLDFSCEDQGMQAS